MQVLDFLKTKFAEFEVQKDKLEKMLERNSNMFLKKAKN